jgi:hypothetical protein
MLSDGSSFAQFNTICLCSQTIVVFLQRSLVMSLSCAYTTVPAKTTLEVLSSFNGESLMCVTCEEEREVLVLSLALVSIIANKCKVPRLSLHLVWGPMAATVDVKYTMCPLNEYRFDTECEDEMCAVCMDPCPDADCSQAPRSRKENCHRCTPAYMCALCRVQLRNGAWCCFGCLEPEDGIAFDNQNCTLKRLQLCYPLQVVRCINVQRSGWC